MKTYSDTQKLSYYGRRTTNSNISGNQRAFAKDRYQTLKDSIIPEFFKRFSLRSVQTNSGSLMTIGDAISTIRSKKDINIRGMSRESKPSARRVKLNKNYDDDLNKLDAFMIRNKMSSSDRLYFKN